MVYALAVDLDVAVADELARDEQVGANLAR